MKFDLKLTKGDEVVYAGRHEAIDAETFGTVFAAVWASLHDKRLQQTTSVGELMSVINEDVLDDVSGSTITIERQVDC